MTLIYIWWNKYKAIMGEKEALGHVDSAKTIAVAIGENQTLELSAAFTAVPGITN